MRQKFRSTTIVYFFIAGAIFLGFIYLGITREFSTSLDLGLVATLWIFVVIAMKTRLVKVPPGTPLPLTNMTAHFNAPNLIRASLSAMLAFFWASFSGWFVHSHNLDDSWYGIALFAVPTVVLIGLFVTFLVRGFEISLRRR